jgi:hypothetical protein
MKLQNSREKPIEEELKSFRRETGACPGGERWEGGGGASVASLGGAAERDEISKERSECCEWTNRVCECKKEVLLRR